MWRTIGHSVVAALAALFLTGAIVFPLLNSHYLIRVVGSFGTLAIVYGIECVVTLGKVETCGFVSGNCQTHNMRAPALVMWIAIFIWLKLKRP